jgi:hypothetical protein
MWKKLQIKSLVFSFFSLSPSLPVSLSLSLSLVEYIRAVCRARHFYYLFTTYFTTYFTTVRSVGRAPAAASTLLKSTLILDLIPEKKVKIKDSVCGARLRKYGTMSGPIKATKALLRRY